MNTERSVNSNPFDDAKAKAARSKETGKRAEDAVLSIFRAQNFTLLARNFTVPRYGELDLIFKKGMCIYVVEVKSRIDSDLFGGAREAVTRRKITRMICAAKVFLLDRRWETFDVRFAAGCVTHRTDGSIVSIHILPIDLPG